jgi:hypothetical protein
MLNDADFCLQVSGADGSPGISERKVGGVNGKVRHHHGDQNFQAAPQTHAVITASNYGSELDVRDGE